MTTYYQALQRESDRRWDYTTSTGSRGAAPIGYCAGWREVPDAEEAARLKAQFGDWFVPQLVASIEEKRAHQAKYHRDGHATAAEAEACYRTYELDNELQLFGDPSRVDTLRRCVAPDGCEAFTAGMAQLGQHRFFYLCDAHRNRETVEKLVIKQDGE